MTGCYVPHVATVAAIYCRISDDREGSGLGVKRQENDCRELCERRGFAVAEVLVDNDLSAYRGKPRPGYQQLLETVKAGTVGVVACWHQDRLTRSPRELEDLVDLIEATGVKIATVSAGDYDLATPTGRMVARNIGSAARYESEHKGERLTRKHLELAQSGKPVGGTRPFGYASVDMTAVDPSEAALIREAVDRVLAGESLRAVCVDWNTRGIVGSRGGPWKGGGLRRVITSPRVAGLRSLKGEVVGQGDWEPILDRTEWERVCALLDARAAGRTFPARSYLLTGFAYCGKCGTRLIGRANMRRKRTYVCTSDPDRRGCGGLRVIAEPFEALVVEAVMQRLDTPELARAIRQREAPHDDGNDALEIQQGTDQLEELARLWGERSITAGEWVEARKPIEHRVEAARRRLAARTDTNAMRPYLDGQGALRAAWGDLSLDQRRAVVEAVVAQITVGPGVPGRTRFDPERVNVDWRA
jgi:site-specific DNA recombinase